MDLLTNAGIFAYPLLIFSLVAVYIMVERLIVLRDSAVIPKNLLTALEGGNEAGADADHRSVMGRIILFLRDRNPDPDAVSAFTDLQISRMERGVFMLEIIVGAAPLVGLLGTVTGLTHVFGGFSIESGLPDPGVFIAGIALALNTTILGLAVAIPSLIAHAFLVRRIDALAARIRMGVECLTHSSRAVEKESS